MSLGLPNLQVLNDFGCKKPNDFRRWTEGFFKNNENKEPQNVF
jgi:hypothetical protein